MAYPLGAKGVGSVVECKGVRCTPLLGMGDTCPSLHSKQTCRTILSTHRGGRGGRAVTSRLNDITYRNKYDHNFATGHYELAG